MAEDNWFHGKLTRDASENVLKEHGLAEGLFLVRESSTAIGDFVLSCVVHDKEIIHYQLRRCKDGQDALFSLADDKKVIHGLDELVYFYTNQPSSGLQHRLTHFVPGLKCPTSVLSLIHI